MKMTILILSCFTIANVILADEPLGSAMASNQTVRCEFTATVVSLSEITNTLLPREQLNGYLIHTNALWQLVLEVHPHFGKTLFQPGTRTCWIRSVEDVFAVSAKHVKGEYRFTYLWNIAVPGKPEVDEFKATKQESQNQPSDRTR
jgi:hypothetical protein